MVEKIAIPTKGVDKRELLAAMEAMSQGDVDWKEGRTWSLVYYAGEEHLEFIKDAHNLFFSTNGLNPMAFKSLKQMEAEVVRMSANMLHGNDDVVGTMTSGGTESILMAVKAARERARGRFSVWPSTPEIVAPRTTHVALEKAAHYFGAKVRFAPIDKNYQVDVRAVKRLINRNTMLVTASAPQYAHGMVDPIAEIGEYTKKRDIPLHVDACFGGFLLPWVEKLGYEVPLWDFRVPGVTSISADLHKYGYSAKGASVVLYRDMSYLKHQFFVSTDWPGGIYASPGMAGTRPGGCISAAWAAMMALGEDGYMELTRASMEATHKMRKAMEEIPELEILGSRHCTILTFGSRDKAVDIYAVADQMNAKNWHLDRHQNPACLHLTVSAGNMPVLDEFINDLREAVAHVKAHPELASSGEAAMYGMMAKIPFRGAVKYSVLKVMESMYGPNAVAPDLANVGAGEDSGPMLKALDKYGDQALGLLNKLEDSRERVRGLIGRRK